MAVAASRPAAPVPQFYRYEAQTPDGQPLRGTLEALSPEAVQQQLAALKLTVLVVEPAAPGEARRRPPLGPSEFLIFNQQLAHLTSAGLPVERGLRLIAADLHTGRLATAANAVADDLEKGMPLQDAFARHASRFPPLYGRLVDAGVQAHNLPSMLFNLGHHLELLGRLRQSLWRTLAYPVLVLVAMGFVLLFICTVVLPQFREMYRDFRTSLPALTEFILNAGEVYPAFFATVMSVGILGLLLSAGMKLSGRSGDLADRLFWVPLVGPVLRSGFLARWIDALRLGIEAGLDLPRALALASDAIASPRLSAESNALSEHLAAGKPAELYQGRIIPQTVPTSIELATRAGSASDLPATLATLARMYQQQAEQRIRLIPMFITPAALMLLAAVVMTTITAMFLPLFKLIQSVSGG